MASHVGGKSEKLTTWEKHHFVQQRKQPGFTLASFSHFYIETPHLINRHAFCQFTVEKIPNIINTTPKAKTYFRIFSHI